MFTFERGQTSEKSNWKSQKVNMKSRQTSENIKSLYFS